MSSELNNTKHFSKIDLREEYHQRELHPSSCRITGFSRGTSQSKRSIYGEKPAFQQFRKIIEQCKTACPGTKSIADDILVWPS